MLDLNNFSPFCSLYLVSVFFLILKQYWLVLGTITCELMLWGWFGSELCVLSLVMHTVLSLHQSSTPHTHMTPQSLAFRGETTFLLADHGILLLKLVCSKGAVIGWYGVSL